MDDLELTRPATARAGRALQEKIEQQIDDGDQPVLGNLPGQLTRLVGRERALEELTALTWGTRLLTLCGPAGAGKTRLAIAVAEAVRADCVGGAWFVDLATTLDNSLVGQVVATALLPGEPTIDPTPAAIARRFSGSTLLVLDNCEQVVEGCAELITALLGHSHQLRIMATSRRSLGVPGEHVWRTVGLDVVDDEAGPDDLDRRPGELRGAVALFYERAREASSLFDPDRPEVRGAVLEICRRLDGMPLAIQLAAARVPVLGVAQIAERLAQDTSVLRQQGAGVPARHRTLEATLEWSYRLLTVDEQRLFRRLAAFRGTFSLAAAEVICADDGQDSTEVLDALGSLVDRSLVQVVDFPDAPRYELLATVRQYAAHKLDADGVQADIRQRHAGWFHSLARDANRGLAGAERLHWLARIELERDNCNAALHWQLVHAAADAARLASLLWPFWYLRGYYREARLWFEQVLGADAELTPSLRADVLIKAGEVAFLQCDYELAGEHIRRALELTDQLGDRPATATALQRLGSIAREQGHFTDARRLHRDSLAIWRELGDCYGIARSQNYLGFVAWLAGDHAGAAQLCGEALSVFQRDRHDQDAVEALVNLGAAALYGEELELARERLEQALTLSRELGFQEGIAWSQHELAIAGRRSRRPQSDNAGRLQEALLIHQRLGDRWRITSVLEEIAGGLLARDDPTRAVVLLRAAQSLRERLGAPVPPVERSDRDAALARARSRLRPVKFESTWSGGRALAAEDAIDLAVVAIHRLTSDLGPRDDVDLAATLTRRELAVLELLSQGHTNREIAAALYISPSTAGVHVSNILHKLGAKRRVDAVAMAHKLGLQTVS